MSSVLRALRMAICSAEFIAFRICVTQGCLAIAGIFFSVSDSFVVRGREARGNTRTDGNLSMRSSFLKMILFEIVNANNCQPVHDMQCASKDTSR
jgi:hypothetical protein